MTYISTSIILHLVHNIVLLHRLIEDADYITDDANIYGDVHNQFAWADRPLKLRQPINITHKNDVFTRVRDNFYGS